MGSPFNAQSAPVDPGKHLPALQEQRKDTPRHRPRISLYRWLGQSNDDSNRRVTFKHDEKQDGDQTNDSKEALETMVQNHLEPKISSDETKEYERYTFLIRS
jgi:hypothetical protein